MLAAAAVVRIGTEVLDALVAAAAAQEGAVVAAFAAMEEVERQIVDAAAVATGLEGRAADVAADFVPDRAGRTHRGEADLVGGTGRAAGGAVVAVGLDIGASAGAADQTRIAGGVAGAAVAFVGIEIEALAAALVAAALAAALAALASRAGAAVGVLIAVLTDPLADRRSIAETAARQDGAEHAAQKEVEGTPARRRDRPGEGIEA